MPPDAVMTIRSCRSCASERLTAVFELGDMPPSDAFSPSATAPDPVFPLSVVFCEDCSLAQLRHTVAPELLFADGYQYFSAYTDTVVQNAEAGVEAALQRRSPAPGALVVELASNDGYLLRHAQARGLGVLGIDPAAGPVAAARERGIETIQAFFSSAVAADVRRTHGPAELVFANNVLAHVAEPRDFVRGIAQLLSAEGLALVEVPHLQALLEKTAFDTIYHEHLCYFSLTALMRLFEAEGLFVTDVSELEIHGGSLRLFVEHRPARSPAVERRLAAEREAGLHRADVFATFADDVARLGERLRTILVEARRQGARLAAYGAAAKGTILLNAFGIDGALLDYVADRNPHKHGLHVPGVKLPICGLETLKRQPPDLLLILPWNHRAEIMRQLADFSASGGALVIPVPEPRVVRA
jgi:SAM-dependent methyltransferase